MQNYSKHPRNRGFEWQPPPRAGGLVTDAQAREFDERGYFELANAFTAAEVAEVIAAIDPLEAETEAFLQSRENGEFGISKAGEITFHPHLVQRSDVLRRFAAHPLLANLVADLLGSDARLYWDQSVYKKPGTAREFPWHQDNGYTFVEPQQYLTCWIALTDATEDNGCPWVVPEVHRLGTLVHRLGPFGLQCFAQPENAAPLPLAAGSIAVFSSLTPHRTGPNLTDSIRKSYILQYAPDGALAYPRSQPPRLGVDDLEPLGEGIPCNDPERQFPVGARSDHSQA